MKTEFEVMVDIIKEILPLAQLGQFKDGSNEFLAFIDMDDEKPYIVNIRITLECIGDEYEVNIESSHELKQLSDRMKAKKAIQELLQEIGLN